MNIPIVAAQHGSGVTQDDLNAALVRLIEQRTVELLVAIKQASERVAGVLDALATERDTSEHSMARAMRVIDLATEEIARHRVALQDRLEALKAARHHAEASPASTLKQSA